MPTLQSGSHVGSYEILGPIGSGGMGEVYRARDTRLKRDVAIKVLPVEWARDPERLARAQREAEVWRRSIIRTSRRSTDKSKPADRPASSSSSWTAKPSRTG